MSDIVELMAKALRWRCEYEAEEATARSILAALSEAGYAVVPRGDTVMNTAATGTSPAPFGTTPSVYVEWGGRNVIATAASPASPSPGIVHKREPYTGEDEGQK